MQKNGILYIVGIGAGDRGGMTQAAYSALEQADVIAGYKTYIDLLQPLFPAKELYATGMMKELERCKEALSLAASGKTVALVCSGDAGVYGMASLVYELVAKAQEQADAASEPYAAVSIDIIAGVTAACSGAALLGAPLANDFAVISLSNLLTPQPLIERRLRAAAAGDFCIALYNPMSHQRPDTLRRACTLLLETLPPQTPCGWVRNIGRAGEEAHICTLSELADAKLDMLCTAFIGNSATHILTVHDASGVMQRLVTARGYENKS